MQVVGNGVTPIVDTWWQTETGSHLITPLPYATDLKPGSATLPFFGVEPAILNEKVAPLLPLQISNSSFYSLPYPSIKLQSVVED